ncbi:AMP-binding protein [Candidatus Woesearchaeota archaeon]|nr:AMP-binding protein [Candidatus Woesearchaeota archaeon]
MDKLLLDELDRLKNTDSKTIAESQSQTFVGLVDFHYNNNARYRRMMDLHGVSPKHIKSSSDITRLPIVTSKDITDDPIDEFHSVPEHEIARFLQTSGSTGKCKRIPVTNQEKEGIFVQTAVMNFLAGVKGYYKTNGGDDAGGKIYSLFPCGPWPSQFFSLNACSLIGPTVTAGIHLPFDWHVEELLTMKPKYLITYPSFLSFFWKKMSPKMDISSLGLERIVLAGEPFSETDRKRYERLFKTSVSDLYGCAEIYGAASECDHLRESGWMHWYSPNLIMEVLDKETLEPIDEPQKEGIMVVTNLLKRAIPIVRYRMGDLISKGEPNGSCGCGLNLPLISRIKGRYDDTFQYGGANIYPDQIHSAAELAGFEDKYQLTLTRKSDENDGVFSDAMVIYVEKEVANEREKREMESAFSRKFNEALSNSSLEYSQIVNIIEFCPPAQIELVEPGRLFNESKTKLKKIIDLRR